ncbi:MAG TPA: hypothetical protein VMU86_09735 [Steroidobacteraceae bacterium]|nr:hypothetical protein [Steroidobacteraceae bacterium]
MDLRSLIRFVCAGLICVVPIAAGAAVIDGKITFPGSDNPAVTVYVYSLDPANLRSTPVRHGRGEFHIAVPPGHYVVFAAPSGAGAPDVYGAYTHCSDVGSGPSAGGASAPAGVANCADHSLRTVAVDRGAHRVDVAIDDWALSDADADALDRIRGLSATPGSQPEGAPRFSEYPVPAATTTAVAAPPTARLRKLALGAADRAKLRDVLAAGPNFAGEVTIVEAHCGVYCLRVLLLDWRSGRVFENPNLAAIDDGLPCRTSESVLFRRDSRLLSVTRMRGGVIATQYFVWDPSAASLTVLAVYPRRRSEYCAIDPP